MAFPTNLYGAVLLMAFLVSAGSLPLWRRWCRRRGWVDDPGHRKIHHVPVPLAGGFAVFTGMAAVLGAAVLAIAFRWMPAEPLAKLSYGLGRRSVELTTLLLGAVGMLALGGWDDRRELSPRVKFAGQCLIALAVSLSGVRITLFVPSLVFSHAVTVLWILTVTNAFNINDNMNGLCAGLGAIASGWIAFHAGREGQYLVASMALLVLGSLLGFLPYNYPKASVFLGDAGSHLVGYLMSVLAVLPHFYSPKQLEPSRWAVLCPLLILAVPLADLVSVVWIRTRRGRPFWIGDTNHFSHRLTRAGLGRSEAVLVLWLAAVWFGALTLLF
ncbi:MAG: MraY family glycosyltransferase [Verrucomicrobiota bacterium]